MTFARRAHLFLAIFLIGILFFPPASLGVMSSTNYTIFADSIDSGGVLSASGTYSLEDTFGESPVGTSTGGVYEIIGGYQAMDWSELVLEINASTVDLGNLTVVQVASTTAVATVVTNADTGYVLSVGAVGGTSLTGVSDGAVTAGQEEYGIAVAGVDAAFADDRAIIAGLNLAASTTPVTGAQSNLIFKAAVSASTASGARSQSITLTASTNI